MLRLTFFVAMPVLERVRRMSSSVFLVVMRFWWVGNEARSWAGWSKSSPISVIPNMLFVYNP